jgi:hypothetical protein
VNRTFGQFTASWAAKQGQFPNLVPTQEPPRAPPEAHQRGMVRGERVECAAPAGLFRPCGCGSTRFHIGPGAGPHIASLRCDDCGVGGRWLSKRHLLMDAS